MIEQLKEIWQTAGPPAWWAATGGYVLSSAGILTPLFDLFAWGLSLVAGDGRLWLSLAGLATSSTGMIPWMTQQLATGILVGVSALVVVAKLYTSRQKSDD